MSTSEQVNFVFRHQPKKTSKYGILLAYLNRDEADMTRLDRLLHPLAAFWLPFAYQRCTNASPKEVQQLARSAVYQLKLHIRYLEDSFGIDGNPRPLEFAEAEENQFSSNGWHESEDLEEAEDFSDEDDILGQIV
jgi:hypothetical protein